MAINFYCTLQVLFKVCNWLKVKLIETCQISEFDESKIFRWYINLQTLICKLMYFGNENMSFEPTVAPFPLLPLAWASSFWVFVGNTFFLRNFWPVSVENKVGKMTKMPTSKFSKISVTRFCTIVPSMTLFQTYGIKSV